MFTEFTSRLLDTAYLLLGFTWPAAGFVHGEPRLHFPYSGGTGVSGAEGVLIDYFKRETLGRGLFCVFGDLLRATCLPEPSMRATSTYKSNTTC